jgi:hypothetical protein
VTIFQPNVAALLNNAYALPVFSAAAYFKGSGDLSILDFAEKVFCQVVRAWPKLL